MTNQTVVRDSYLGYYSRQECVVCQNKDFVRIECGTQKILQKHELNHISLNSGMVIVFCDSCLYDLKNKLTKEMESE